MTLRAILKNNKRGGFSAIELLVIISISLVVLSVAVPIYGNLQGSSQIGDVSSGVIQTIRMAKERSINGLNGTKHGIYFDLTPDNNKYILYQGDSYATRDNIYDRVIGVDSVITITTTISGNEINFSKGIGTPNNTGQIIISHPVNGNRSITVNSFGRADLD